MDGTKFLFALRHGERADKVALHRQPKQYLPYDCPITDLGVLQAQRSALLIENFSPPGATFHIVSSPFLRCVQTAGEVAKRLRVPVHIEEGFADWLSRLDFGKSPLDAMSYPHLIQALGVEIVVNSPQLATPSFPETLPECMERVRTTFQQYLSQVSETVLVIVTHLHPINSLSQLWSGKPCTFPEENNCLISHAEFTNGEYTMVLSGDHTHAPQYLR